MFAESDSVLALIIEGSSAQNNSNALSYQKMVKNLLSSQHDSPVLMVIEDCKENCIAIHSFDATKISGIDRNSDISNYSVSDSAGSVYFRIDNSCSIEIDANVNDHTCSTINPESNI